MTATLAQPRTRKQSSSKTPSRRRRPRGTIFLRFVRWWVTLLGGVLLGAGLCLHGQLAVAQHMRDQVQDTFFLWRGIGQVTFIFQDEVTQAALWMNEIPQEVVRESDSAAWTLCVLGAMLAFVAPFLRRREKAKRRRAA